MSFLSDLAKFSMRLFFGLSLALAHGLPKLLNFVENSKSFPDPFGVGHIPSLAFVVLAEFFCAILVALGAFSRITCIPVVIVMATAFFKIHAGMPWENWDSKEAAALYGVAFVCIGLLGSGKLSFDYLVFKKR